MDRRIPILAPRARDARAIEQLPRRDDTLLEPAAGCADADAVESTCAGNAIPRMPVQVQDPSRAVRRARQA